MSVLGPYVRGSTVNLSVTFRNSSGEAVSVASASLYLSYLNVARVRVSETIELTNVTGSTTWTAKWDSRPAAAGEVLGHLRSPAPIPISATDFTIILTRNLANPNP